MLTALGASVTIIRLAAVPVIEGLAVEFSAIPSLSMGLVPALAVGTVLWLPGRKPRSSVGDAATHHRGEGTRGEAQRLLGPACGGPYSNVVAVEASIEPLLRIKFEYEIIFVWLMYVNGSKRQDSVFS